LLGILLQTWLPSAQVLAIESPGAVDVYGSDFTRQYTALTKQILLKAIGLERFSLNYRMKSDEKPKFRRWRFFLAQEAGASTILAFEIVGDKQLGLGKRHPLKISKRALHDATATALTGSIIAGGDSCLELALNELLAVKHKQEGFDPASSRKSVLSQLKQMDELLAEREAFVQAHPEHPAYSRAVIEGNILRELRKAFLNEFATFQTDAKGYATFTNLFLFLNVAANAIGATAAGMAYKGVNAPQVNGTANILFIVAGSVIMVTPWISSLSGILVRRHTYNSFWREVGETPVIDMAQLAADRKRLGESLSSSQGSLIPSLPGVERLALYSESNELFKKQLKDETTVTRHLEKVAVESNLLGPMIGGALMTQGILGTVGCFRYPIQPRKQVSLLFRGAVVGTAGSGLAVVGTAAWFLASLSYDNHLRKRHRLPVQLIKDRLAHLDEVEKIVQSL
jgi:hypothetical protein